MRTEITYLVTLQCTTQFAVSMTSHNADDMKSVGITSDKVRRDELHHTNIPLGFEILLVKWHTRMQKDHAIITLTMPRFKQCQMHLLHIIYQRKQKTHTSHHYYVIYTVFKWVVLSIPRSLCRSLHVHDPAVLSVCSHNTCNIINKSITRSRLCPRCRILMKSTKHTIQLVLTSSEHLLNIMP